MERNSVPWKSSTQERSNENDLKGIPKIVLRISETENPL
jgi:hypothetical protein